MKNMKKLLGAMAALGFTTVSAINVVACVDKENKNNKMNTQVEKDFGFKDANGKSLIDLIIKVNTDKSVSWKSNALSGITADKLLQTGSSDVNKAKSADAADFLVDVLKLKAASGKGGDRMFKHSDARSISLETKEYLPTITKNSGSSDYVVTGGTVTIKFIKDAKQIGDLYSLDILGNTTSGIVLSNLPPTGGITLNNFNSIPGFLNGGQKSNFPVGQDLTTYFKTDVDPGKTVKNIVDLIKQGDLKIKVSTAAGSSGTFSTGDTIKIKISIGTVTFVNEYTLTIA